MAYQINPVTTVTGYLAAIDAKIATMSLDESMTFLEKSLEVVASRKIPGVSPEALEQLDYLLKELTKRYWFKAGWLDPVALA